MFSVAQIWAVMWWPCFNQPDLLADNPFETLS